MTIRQATILEPSFDAADRASAVSGLVWGVVGFSLAYRAFGGAVWAGVAAAPLIGILIGRLGRPLRRWPMGVQMMASLAHLYLAAALFGVAITLAVLALPRGPRVSIEIVLSVLWGLTFSGYVFVLWPLTHLNHRFVWAAEGGADDPTLRIPLATAATRRVGKWTMALSLVGLAVWSMLRALAAGLNPGTASTMPWWIRGGPALVVTSESLRRSSSRNYQLW